MNKFFDIAEKLISTKSSIQELYYKYSKKDVDIIIKLKQLLDEIGWKCNAEGRSYIAERMPCLPPRSFNPKKWLPVLQYAKKIGGCIPGTSYQYPNAQGGFSTAEICKIDDLPSNMVNPYLVTFGGVMTAPFFGMEILRFYAKKTGKLLPVLCIGKCGNKGLFEKVFNRPDGLIRNSEYEAYLNVYEQMAPTQHVRANQKVFEDIDTAGNLLELHRFAWEEGLKEITFVLCTGNPFYDKRLLAEWMLMLKEPAFADIKINLVLAHCPLYLKSAVPEGHLSEILLGYAAASIGPLMKDTVPFQIDRQGERYLMDGVKEAAWSVFKELISCYSNMGWPNYMEILYDTNHQTAVAFIILSDLFARQNISAADYDLINKDIIDYENFIGKYKGGDFLNYLKQTPDQKYFD